MPKKSSSTRVLRQLAEELIEQMAEEYSLSNSDRADLATSLVRQWITYDGHATLFLDAEQQIYLHLVRTPLGRPRPVPEAGALGWLSQLVRDHQIDADDVPEIIDQLNRGQSAEVTNQEGIPLRVWVNPKERSRGFEVLAKQQAPADPSRLAHWQPTSARASYKSTIEDCAIRGHRGRRKNVVLREGDAP